MRAARAYRVVAQLERRAAARLAATDASLAHLVRARNDILAASARARHSMLALPHWDSLACHALATHTTLVAARAERISAQQRVEIEARSPIARERAHWARCRVGLERRARRDIRLSWPG